MSTFSIESFADSCKQAMLAADNEQKALRVVLEQTIAHVGVDNMIEALEGAIPAGASVGEMIVHASSELTLLYGRIPPKFQSGIHNHTIFACIAQLEGHETNTIYEENGEEGTLSANKTVTINPGEIIDLPADVVHSIANPDAKTSRALHVYAGNFRAIEDQRSLWASDSHEEIPFSFKSLLQESVKTMKQANNDTGLNELAKAIPAVKPMVDAA
jgi:predicted metal-dependent enzyme (double-stranded beta helix superfamily)